MVDKIPEEVKSEIPETAKSEIPEDAKSKSENSEDIKSKSGIAEDVKSEIPEEMKSEKPEEVKSVGVTDTDDRKAALNVFVQGKRHLMVKEVTLAVAELGKACQLLAEHVGVFTAESGEAHYYYGKSLLEQARMDLSVFEPQTAAAKSDDEDEEEAMEDGDEAEGEGSAGPSVTSDEVATVAEEQEKDLKDEDDKAEGEGEGSAGPSVVDTDATAAVDEEQAMEEDDEAEGEGSPSDDPDATAAEDEPTNLELAWEVLEVAKVTYTRLIEGIRDQMTESEEKIDNEKVLKTYKNRLANVYSLLGEVATESEQYPQAVQEITTALTILNEIDEPDSREIAQCEFQLGIAHSFDKQYEDAIKTFKKSSEIIEKRIENLEKLPKTCENENSVAEEIAELKALLPELKEKINDTLDAEKDAVRVVEEETEDKERIKRNSPVKNNPNPPIINDISHLVKKKRKVETVENAEGGVGEEPQAKKMC